MEYYYLLLNLISVFFPIVLSFDKKVRFVKNWPFALAGVALTMLIFIPWDAYFTAKAVWGFTPKYLTGIEVFGLPLEENLFFFTVPFACIFVAECVRNYLPNFVKWIDTKLHWSLLLIFNGVTLYLLVIYWGKWYSMSAFIGCMVFVNLVVLFARNYVALGLISFAFICIPFLLINGALTGSFSNEPVVWYNLDHFSGIRVGTIPMEDFFYNMMMMITMLAGYFLWKRLVMKRAIEW